MVAGVQPSAYRLPVKFRRDESFSCLPPGLQSLTLVLPHGGFSLRVGCSPRCSSASAELETQLPVSTIGSFRWKLRVRRWALKGKSAALAWFVRAFLPEPSCAVERVKRWTSRCDDFL